MQLVEYFTFSMLDGRTQSLLPVPPLCCEGNNLTYLRNPLVLEKSLLFIEPYTFKIGIYSLQVLSL